MTTEAEMRVTLKMEVEGHEPRYVGGSRKRKTDFPLSLPQEGSPAIPFILAQ